MISKKISYFFLSTFLLSVSSDASASLSEAFNGFIDENIRTEAWQRNSQKEFAKRFEERAALYETLERHFAPVSRKGTIYDRHKINAIVDFLEQEYEKTYNQKIFFEASLGDPKFLPTGEMDKTTVMGVDVKLQREIKNLEAEKKELENSLIKAEKGKEVESDVLENDQDNNINHQIKKLDERIKILHEEVIEKVILNTFMKYMAWSNIYYALRSEDKIDFISPALYPKILDILNQKIDLSSKDIQHKTKELIVSEIQDFHKHIVDKARNVGNYSTITIVDQEKNEMIKDKSIINEKIKNKGIDINHLTEQELETHFNSFDPVSIVKNKADQYFKKLQKNISELKHDSFSIVLQSALLNNHYSEDQRAKMLSFEFLDENYSQDELKNISKEMKENNYLKIGLSQVKTELFEKLQSKEQKKIEILQYLQNYLNSKIQLSEKKEHPIQKKNSSRNDPHSALLKMVGYANMTYALKYNFEGTKNPSLKFYDDTIAPYIKEDFPKNLGLDKIMAVKALKWKERFLELKKDEFMTKYALKSYSFASKDNS